MPKGKVVEDLAKSSTPDDRIIKDLATRRLLRSLLGRWSAPGDLSKRLSTLVMDEWEKESAPLYESAKASGAKVADALRIERDALIEANIYIENNLGEIIERYLGSALEEVATNASRAMISSTSARAKGAIAKAKRSSTFKLYKNLADAGVMPRVGRPRKYTDEYIVRRSLDIIRVLNAGPGDKGRVGIAYYDEQFNPADPNEKDRIERAYQAARRAGYPDRYLKTYLKLLKDHGISYDELLHKRSEG